MSLTPEREAALIAAAARGKGAARDQACRELYEALRPKVWALCVRLAGDPATAEDALQDTFFNVFAHLRGFRGDARLSTYVFRIAVRAALEARARRPVQQPLEEASQVASEAPTVDAVAAARERARRTQQAFRKLSAPQQTVLSLFAIEGLPHQEIAAVLGIPEGTVWYRLHEARKALSARVAELEAASTQGFSRPAL